MASGGRVNVGHFICAGILLTSLLLARQSDGFFIPSSRLPSPAPIIGELARRPRSGSSRSRGASDPLRMASNPPESTAVAVTAATLPSWKDLARAVSDTPVGRTLDADVELRRRGLGGPHVQNTLRLFDSGKSSSRSSGELSGSNELPKIILYRDHAGWCPYCQKTMLLVEEKRVPVRISLVNMRAYGDKPAEFLRKVPGGLLPALEIADTGQVITESQVIMELLDEWHSEEDGYRPMSPPADDAPALARYERLARLERELFSWWCTLVFRPEGPANDGNGGFFSRLNSGGNGKGKNNREYPHTTMKLSDSMRGFLDCMATVNEELLSTQGPWFFDTFDYPTMIDFIYVSHVERMLASCAYWKGLNLRDPKWEFDGLVSWLEGFEKREPYLAFTSDYYTHVLDIPPQYGPAYDGGFDADRRRMQRIILGRDGTSWNLPMPHDDPLQPLYKGPPLPRCVLQAVGLEPDLSGSYAGCDPARIATGSRTMAAWKLSGNGEKVAAFAARGGPGGSKNPRKSFGAQLADPYAEPDTSVLPAADAALRVVCQALLDTGSAIPQPSMERLLLDSVPDRNRAGVAASLAYLRDRVGVPRDLPLASARYLRAYLNWGIGVLSS